jgi:hypothetical protein
MWFERPVRTEAQLALQKPRCPETLPSISNWFKEYDIREREANMESLLAGPALKQSLKAFCISRHSDYYFVDASSITTTNVVSRPWHPMGIRQHCWSESRCWWRHWIEMICRKAMECNIVTGAFYDRLSLIGCS